MCHSSVHTGTLATCVSQERTLNCPSHQHPPLPSPARSRPYSCSVCGKRFSLKHQMETHYRVHTGMGILPSVNLSFLFPSLVCQLLPCPILLDAPLAWATLAHFFLLWLSLPPVGEKPFSCSLCPQRSRDFSAMTKHLRTHGAAPYRCPLCRAGCPSLASMQAHMRGHSPSRLPPGWTIRSTFLYSSSRPTRASISPGSPTSSAAT